MLIKTIVTNTLILTELAKSVKIIYENKRIYAFTEISLNIDTLDVYEEFTYHLYGHGKMIYMRLLNFTLRKKLNLTAINTLRNY